MPDALELFTNSRRRVLGANVHAQAALASFLETGSYRAHIRRLSQAYAERGRRLSHLLREALRGAADVSEPDGGLQLLVRFREPLDERALTARLAEAGFAAAGLSGYCLRPAAAGLVVGFGDASDRRAAAFAALVGRLASDRSEGETLTTGGPRSGRSGPGSAPRS